MFRFSKKTDYALLALQYLASPGESGDVSARAIAERFEIPLELLSKILQRLSRDGLIVAHRGVHGGYRLARSPDAISIADVAQAADGPLHLRTYLPAETRWDQVASCKVRDPLWVVTERVQSLLRVLTVADVDAFMTVALPKQQAGTPAAGRTR
jgi:Rrf2 family protein